jgi:CRP-like cAMP-binding protein
MNLLHKPFLPEPRSGGFPPSTTSPPEVIELLICSLFKVAGHTITTSPNKARQPGDVIGLVALLRSPSDYMATAEATSDCELLAWEHSVLRKLVSQHPLLGENGLQIALDYLRSYYQNHIGLATKTAEERLAETLLRLGDQTGEVHPDGIEIQATNDQLGALANISPFTASRVLTNWARAGIVSKGRGRVTLHAPEALMID